MNTGQPTDAAVDPQNLDPKQFEKWNEDMASKYNPHEFHQKSTWLIRFVEKRRVRNIVRLLKAEDGHAVLEVGCGCGNILAQMKGTRSGIDLSSGLLEQARELCGPGVELKKANAEELPFGDAQFDRVYCTEVLEHVQHPRVAIAEITRVLKPGGRAVLTIPNDDTIARAKGFLKAIGLYRLFLGNKAKGTYEPPEDNLWHVHHLKLKDLRELSKDLLVEQKAVAIPTWLAPVHYVCAFVKPAQAAG